MSFHPWETINKKLERAEKHIEELKGLTDGLIHTAPYTIITDEDPRELEEFKQLLSQIVVPPWVSIVAGEAVHQTRSALDHLASSLVSANKGTVTNKTQFPICPYRPKKKKHIESYEGCVRGMTSSAKTIIEREQPYHASSRHDHPLTILKRLNNRDKHRALLVTLAAVRPHIGYRFEDDFIGSQSPDDPADFVPIEGHHMQVQRGFAAYVVFPEFGSSQNQPVVESVLKLWAYVTYNLVRKFRDELGVSIS